MEDLSKLSEKAKERELNKRTETITKIANEVLDKLLEEEILIGELERIGNYLQIKIQEKVNLHKENTYVSTLNGQ